ncbi:MAG: YIP1 family protein [Candidatus Eisenbacteria bacterium]|nr:YIP1 family protein [Candidatus Eisenbacteria bacterium]
MEKDEETREETGGKIRNGTADGPPWERRERFGAVGGFGKTIVESSLRPTAFFRDLRRSGNLTDAALFGMGIAGITAFVESIWGFFFTPFWLAHGGAGGAPFAPLLAGWAFSWIKIVLAPITMALLLLVVAGLIHGGLLVLGGAKRPFETTFRVVCYSTAPLLLSLIPCCGGPVGKVWAAAVCVIGLRECQEATTGRGIAAVLLPAILMVGCLGLFAAAMLTGVILHG